jgi:hypothetical protein
MPAAGMRRIVVGWSNQLPQIYGDVLTFESDRARAVHVQHAAALKAASLLPVVALTPQYTALSTVEEAWTKHVTSTPGFLNSFGQQGWKIARVSLDRLVMWQPVVDAPRDDAPAMSTEEEIIKAVMPEVAIAPVYSSTLTRDEQGAFRAVLTSADPNHDIDLTLEEGGAGGLRVRLRARSNVVHAMPINGRLVVLNGYHRLARLAAAGYTDAPILLLDPGHNAAGVLADRPGFLPLNLIANIPRPPLIPDFLNGDLTMEMPKPDVARAHDFRFTHTEIPVRRA